MSIEESQFYHHDKQQWCAPTTIKGLMSDYESRGAAYAGIISILGDFSLYFPKGNHAKLTPIEIKVIAGFVGVAMINGAYHLSQPANLNGVDFDIKEIKLIFDPVIPKIKTQTFIAIQNITGVQNRRRATEILNISGYRNRTKAFRRLNLELTDRDTGKLLNSTARQEIINAITYEPKVTRISPLFFVFCDIFEKYLERHPEELS
jgi:hypothetical protein